MNEARMVRNDDDGLLLLIESRTVDTSSQSYEDMSTKVAFETSCAGSIPRRRSVERMARDCEQDLTNSRWTKVPATHSQQLSNAAKLSELVVEFVRGRVDTGSAMSSCLKPKING